MAAEWARMQREGWLCKLYGVDNEDGTRVLPPDGVHVKLVSIMEKLLSLDISPSDAATRTAALIITQKDVHTPVSNLVGMYYGAVQDIDDEKILVVLVDYLAELASLPDAINEGPETKIVWTGLGEQFVEPGQPIVFETGKLWSDLPEWGWNLTEILQGKYTQDCIYCKVSFQPTVDRTRTIPQDARRTQGAAGRDASMEEPQYLPRAQGCASQSADHSSNGE